MPNTKAILNPRSLSENDIAFEWLLDCLNLSPKDLA